MRKSEEIKQLKHELGRYQKKVGDQYKELAILKRQVAAYESGVSETHHAINLLTARLCQSFGVEVVDEDNGNAHIGYRLVFKKPSASVLEKYTQKTEMSDDGEIITIGLVLKGETECADDDDSGETDNEEEPLGDPAGKERETIPGTV